MSLRRLIPFVAGLLLALGASAPAAAALGLGFLIGAFMRR